MRTKLALGLVSVFSCFVSAIASDAEATPAIATSAPVEPPVRRNELHIGMLAGNAEIGDVDGSGIGLEINAGRRFGSLRILGQLDYMGVGDSPYDTDMQRRGTMARLGLLARYALFELGDTDGPLGVGFWIEAGGGRQRIAWDAGGTLSRTDVALGFGFDLEGRLGRHSSSPRFVGPYFAFRAHLARAPESQMPAVPTCGGPCDTATVPSRNDVSLFFNTGMHWGR